MKDKTILRFIKKSIPLLALGIGLFVGLIAIKMNTEFRKKAANASVTLSLFPTNGSINLGNTSQYDLIATFTGGTSTETLDYFRTQIEFDPQYLELPTGNYIDTTSSEFDQIFRVDGPQSANENGKIIIELGSKVHPGPSTNAAVTIAKIQFRGKALTPGTGFQPLTLTQSGTQVVNNQSSILSLTLQTGDYRVVPVATLTPVITMSPSPSPTPTPAPSLCVRGELGNLDCSTDGCIDTSDFELFRQGYGQSTSSLNIPSNHHTPDLIQDAGGFVDTADYNILYQNFGSCSP